VARTIIAGNWKMNTTLAEALDLGLGLADRIGGIAGVERVLIPPFTWIVPLSEAIDATDLVLGAQDCFTEPSGAFTGEVSAEMLVPFCQYVIVGHSERRHVLGERDDLVAGKLRAVQRAGMTPILCVGETLEERDAGDALRVVSRQLRAALKGLEARNVADTVVAYEPVWAIGTGRAAEPEDAQEMAAFIRQEIGELADADTASVVPIQYGGSVKGSNAGGFLSLPDVNGALVGGASLDAEEFAEIVRQAE
jgi:triosephosphate isomerase (TIM)